MDPLKGLPQKKAKRRDQWFSSLSDPDTVLAVEQDKEDVTPYIEKAGTAQVFRTDSIGQEIPEPPPLNGPQVDPLIKVLSYKKFDV